MVAGVTRELAARLRELPVLREPGGSSCPNQSGSSSRTRSCGSTRARRAPLYAGRARAARRRAARAAAQRRPLGPARPLRRLLARLPGRGRALGIEEIRALNLFATGGLPRSHAVAADRPGRRPGAYRRPRRPPPRQAGEAFFDAVARAYDELAAVGPERFALIEAVRPPEQVVADALARSSRCSATTPVQQQHRDQLARARRALRVAQAAHIIGPTRFPMSSASALAGGCAPGVAGPAAAAAAGVGCAGVSDAVVEVGAGSSASPAGGGRRLGRRPGAGGALSQHRREVLREPVDELARTSLMTLPLIAAAARCC